MKTIVVGIGNPYLGDDSAGIRVAQEIERLNKVDVATILAGFEIIDRILGYERAILVDCLRGKNAGKIHVFNLEEIAALINLNKLGSKFAFYTTHTMDLATILKLGYELFPDEMPKDLKIYAIEIVSEKFGDCILEVKEAIDKVVNLIVSEL